jgi:hypothetical protein
LSPHSPPVDRLEVFSAERLLFEHLRCGSSAPRVSETEVLAFVMTKRRMFVPSAEARVLRFGFLGKRRPRYPGRSTRCLLHCIDSRRAEARDWRSVELYTMNLIGRLCKRLATQHLSRSCSSSLRSASFTRA